MINGKQMADVIIEQLGGYGKLTAMIGANNFGYSEKDQYIKFDFKSCKKANVIKIELNRMDLYDLTFIKYNKRSYDFKEVKKITNIFASDLKENVEDFTGLYLSL